MKNKIKYSFWDEESKEIVNDSFNAIAFTMSCWGVSFSVDLFDPIVSFSWDELEKLCGSSVVFCVSKN